MSGEPISEGDALTRDSTISLPIKQYQQLLNTLKTQTSKIQASKNLHQIIQSKDEELRANQEKTQNLQVALDRAEMRLANQIRLAASNGSIKSLSESEWSTVKCSPSKIQTIPQQTTDAVTQDDRDESSAASSDLEADCASVVAPPVAFQQKFHGVASEHSSLPTKSPTWRKVDATTSFSSRTDEDSSVLQNRGLQMPYKLGEKLESLGSLKSVDKVMLSTASQSPAGAIGVSKDLLDKLIQQNARLKKVIRDILSQKGSSVESHLEKQEMQDVIEHLREDLRFAKAQSDRLREAMNTKDGNSILKKYGELSENFQKTKKTCLMMQAMADGFSKELEKSKLENKELKEQLSTMNQKLKSTALRERQGSDVSVESATLVSENATPVESLQHDDVLKELQTKQAEVSALKMQYQQVLEKLAQKEKGYETAEVGLREQCNSLESEKKLLVDQVSLFQEDFMAERKEALEKQRQYEMTIAKHQDWIRTLVSEGQKVRDQLKEEKHKREIADKHAHEIEVRFRSFISDSRSGSTNCRTMVQDNLGMTSLRLAEDLQIDNAPEPGACESNQKWTEVQTKPDDDCDDQDSASPLVCSRCEREFDRKDEQKWRDHTARCMDD